MTLPKWVTTPFLQDSVSDDASFCCNLPSSADGSVKYRTVGAAWSDISAQAHT